MREFLTVMTILIGSTIATSQHFYPEKFTKCNTSVLKPESDTATVKKDPAEFVELFKSLTPEPLLRKIKGIMSLQIIVYQDGSNCLLSILNETNISSDELGLKEMIDNHLTWQPHDELPISAVIELTFKKGKVNYRRMGVDLNKGWHELKNAGAYDQ